VTIHRLDLSEDGESFVNVLISPQGIPMNLADPESVDSAFGSPSIPAGRYDVLRFVLSTELRYSHEVLGLVDVEQTVQGMPEGPYPGTMWVHFATEEEGGVPFDSHGEGDHGTAERPLLISLPVVVEAAGETRVRLIFSITDTLERRQDGSYDLGAPQMFVVSDNGDAGVLAGAYNTVIYNAVKDFIPPSVVTQWEYASAWGLLTFDGQSRWNWSGTINQYDLLESRGSIEDRAVSGLYGVNEDGSIWMVVEGEPGTVRGAVQDDGRIFVGTMVDSELSHFMIFGVERATAASQASLQGEYFEASCGDRYDPVTDRLTTSTSISRWLYDGAGGSVGMDRTRNEVEIAQAVRRPPVSSGPQVETASLNMSDTYQINPDGTYGGAWWRGATLEGGEANCIALNASD